MKKSRRCKKRNVGSKKTKKHMSRRRRRTSQSRATNKIGNVTKMTHYDLISELLKQTGHELKRPR